MGKVAQAGSSKPQKNADKKERKEQSKTKQSKRKPEVHQRPARKPTSEKLPVTLLSGFLGSGKTSLLRHALTNREGLRIAVILNEISEINIDVLALQGAKVMQTDEKIVEMSNGCICCTLREDLLKTLRDLHAQQAFDAVLIESSGIAEPLQVAETFFVNVEGFGQLQSRAPLHNCVTVVDASTLKAHLNDPRAAMAIDPKAKDEKEDQSIGELLIQQIEFANVVVLNKLDLVTGEKSLEAAMGAAHAGAVGELKSLVRSINPTAEIVLGVRSEINVREVLGAGRFSEEWAKSVAGWMEDIESGITHTPETLEYGIGSYLYTASRPFHPQRVHEWIDKMYFWNEIAFEEVEEPEEDEEGEEGEEATSEAGANPSHSEAGAAAPKADRSVALDIAPLNAEGFQEFGAEEKKLRDATYGNFFRSKGFIWLGNPQRVEHVMEWSQAGTVLNLQYSSSWENFSTQERGQRLVFIGQNIDKAALKRDLDALLLTEEEWANLQSGAYDESPLPDPFEPFPQAQEAEDDDDKDEHHHDHQHHHGGSCSHAPKAAAARKRSREE